VGQPTRQRRDVDLFVGALKEINLLPSDAYATSDGEPDFARAAATIAELRDVLPVVVTHQLPPAVVAKAFRFAAGKSTAR
jgi:hypothetical protein